MIVNMQGMMMIFPCKFISMYKVCNNKQIKSNYFLQNFTNDSENAVIKVTSD